MNWKQIKTSAQIQIEQNPLGAAVIAGALLLAGARVMQANTERQNAKVWKKEVERRTIMGTK